jgi:hypothetical protein
MKTKKQNIVDQSRGGSLHPICSAWVPRTERLPDADRRILALSPVYPVGHEMRHRMMDARFFRICTEATHWLDVQTIEPNDQTQQPHSA